MSNQVVGYIVHSHVKVNISNGKDKEEEGDATIPPKKTKKQKKSAQPKDIPVYFLSQCIHAVPIYDGTHTVINNQGMRFIYNETDYIVRWFDTIRLEYRDQIVGHLNGHIIDRIIPGELKSWIHQYPQLLVPLMQNEACPITRELLAHRHELGDLLEKYAKMNEEKDDKGPMYT